MVSEGKRARFVWHGRVLSNSLLSQDALKLGRIDNIPSVIDWSQDLGLGPSGILSEQLPLRPEGGYVYLPLQRIEENPSRPVRLISPLFIRTTLTSLLI
jgi:hypothetical protein